MKNGEKFCLLNFMCSTFDGNCQRDDDRRMTIIMIALEVKNKIWRKTVYELNFCEDYYCTWWIWFDLQNNIV